MFQLSLSVSFFLSGSPAITISRYEIQFKLNVIFATIYNYSQGVVRGGVTTGVVPGDSFLCLISFEWLALSWLRRGIIKRSPGIWLPRMYVFHIQKTPFSPKTGNWYTYILLAVIYIHNWGGWTNNKNKKKKQQQGIYLNSLKSKFNRPKFQFAVDVYFFLTNNKNTNSNSVKCFHCNVDHFIVAAVANNFLKRVPWNFPLSNVGWVGYQVGCSFLLICLPTFKRWKALVLGISLKVTNSNVCLFVCLSVSGCVCVWAI